MKKIVSLTLAALMLTGCAGKGGSSLQPTTNEDGKTVITLAYLCSIPDEETYSFEHTVYDYNRNNSKYEVEMTVYTEEEGQSAFNKLSSDLADGKTPDIIFGATSRLRTLYDRGYLADLGEIMDDYDGVKRDEIVPSLLNAMSIDGHIPVMPSAIYAETMCIDTERLGEDITDWNFDQAIGLYNSLSDDDKKHFLPFQYSYMGNKKAVANYLIEGAVISCMDYRSYTFDPEKGLRKALEFISTLPDDSDVYRDAEIFPVNYVLTNPHVSVSSFYSVDAIGNHHGKEISLVGYPTETGSGVLVHAYSAYGIMDNSPSKEGAWDYINSLSILSDDPYKSVAGNLPLRSSAYPRLYDIDPISNSSINIGFIKEGGVAMYPEKGDFSITDAQKQQLKDYIADLDFCIYHDEEIENIIREECGYVVSGERTPDQCIDILNDRVGTYMAENK